jgi:hypothetical protein
MYQFQNDVMNIHFKICEIGIYFLRRVETCSTLIGQLKLFDKLLSSNITYILCKTEVT